MFYSRLKKDILEDHKRVIKEYNASYKEMQSKLECLYRRRKISVKLISEVENLVNSIANSPKDYKVKTQKIKVEWEKFHKTEEYGKEAYDIAVKSGVDIVSGVAGGAAVAAAAPSVAMWVATTFGTASTGTAISSLSGAAATNAALAWLGGGALTAGGAGIAGGEAVLALAGPIGWIIAGSSIVISASALSIKNKKIAEKAAEEVKIIKAATARMRETMKKVESLSNETIMLFSKLKALYAVLEDCQGKDFTEFGAETRKQFGYLVNSTLSLSEMLNKTVQESHG